MTTNDAYYYHQIGAFYMESSRCLVGDSIVTLDCDDNSKIRECKEPKNYISKAYQENCLILKDLCCKTLWNVYLQINLNTHEPVALIAFESDFLGDSKPSEVDNASKWDTDGHFKASLSMGIFDFQYFDDDDIIIANFPEEYGKMTSAWYHYATDIAAQALHQYSCDIILFGVSMTNLMNDNLFTVSSITQLGIYEKVGIKIGFIDCKIGDPLFTNDDKPIGKVDSGLVDYNLGEPIVMGGLPVLPDKEPMPYTGPTDYGFGLAVLPTTPPKTNWSNYLQTSLYNFFDKYDDAATDKKYLEERAALLGKPTDTTAVDEVEKQEKEQMTALLEATKLENGTKVNSGKIKEL